MQLVEASMRQVAEHRGGLRLLTAELDFRALFAPTVNDPAETSSPRVCTELRSAPTM